MYVQAYVRPKARLWEMVTAPLIFPEQRGRTRDGPM